MKMQNVATLFLATGLILLSQTVSAQSNIYGLSWDESAKNSIEVVKTTNAESGTYETINTIQFTGQKRFYVQNSLSYNKGEDILHFVSSEQNPTNGTFGGGMSKQYIATVNAKTGTLLSEIPFHNTRIINPFFTKNNREMGFLSITRTFSGYDNNDDDVNFLVIDLTTGEKKHEIALPSLSIAAMTTPFVGEVRNFNNQTGGSHQAISSSCYIPELNELVFIALDVTNTSRLYRIDLTNGTLKSKLSVEFGALDIAYDATTGMLNLLYFKPDATGYDVRVGRMPLSGNKLVESALVHKVASSSSISITDGSIEINQQTGGLIVTKAIGASQFIYSFDKDLVAKSSKPLANGNTKVDFKFPNPISNSNQFGLDKLVSLHPNPASTAVNVQTEGNVIATGATILNSVGQVVKQYDIQSGLKVNELNVSDLKPGIYHVRITSDNAEPVSKKLLVQ